jgi:Polyketide cyclase / dehydrase and lipid transport
MPASDYSFTTRWRVEGSCGEVADVLGDPLSLPRWWPAVYLQAREVAPPDARGRGRRVALRTKGWLPYTLRWELETVAVDYPRGIRIAASGDLDGAGAWTFAQDGPFVDISFDWRIRAAKPLLQRLSPVLRPLFESNHRWAMAEGEVSLALELARRRAASPADVPAPPGPVTYAVAALLAGGAAAVAATMWLLVRTTRRGVRAE